MEIEAGRKWSLWNSLKHQFFDCLMPIGLRDRLRCPACSAVGTWKPHGGYLERFHNWRIGSAGKLLPGVPYATTRRWVCKYCGFTHDMNGTHVGAPHALKRVWDYRGPDSFPTPKEAVEKLCGPTWPWNG